MLGNAASRPFPAPHRGAVTSTVSLGPIFLQPIFKEKVWGDSLPDPYSQPERGKRVGEVSSFVRLITCPYFIVDHFELTAGQEIRLEQSSSLQILLALGKGCSLADPMGDSQSKIGITCLF